MGLLDYFDDENDLGGAEPSGLLDVILKKNGVTPYNPGAKPDAGTMPDLSGMYSQRKRPSGPNLALLAAAAGLMRPTRGGNFGEAMANGLQGYVSGAMSQRQLEQEDEAARYKQVANQLAAMKLSHQVNAPVEYGVSPVMDSENNLYLVGKDGSLKPLNMKAPKNYGQANFGGSVGFWNKNDPSSMVTVPVTQTPDNTATTGVNVGPAGASPVPNWRQNKADTSGAVTGAETSAKSRAEELEKLGEDLRKSGAITDILQAPYSIAGGGKKTIPEMFSEATGSLPGMLQDKAKSMLGITSEGAKMNQILSDLSTSLIGQIDRMPGAQSDADLMFLRQQAGDLGNPEIPVGIRAQKYQTMLDLQNRRQQRIQGRQQEIGVNPNPAMPGAPAVMETGSNPAQMYRDIQSMPDGPEKRQAMQALGAGSASSMTPQQAPAKPFVPRGAAPRPEPIPASQLPDLKRLLSEKPERRDTVIRELQRKGYDTEGL